MKIILLFNLILGFLVNSSIASTTKVSKVKKELPDSRKTKLERIKAKNVNHRIDEAQDFSTNAGLLSAQGSKILFAISDNASSFEVGSRAALGVSRLDNTLVSDFKQIAYRTKTLMPGANPDSVIFLEAVVDLECDDSSVVVLKADPQIAKPGVQDDDGFVQYLLNLDDKIWRYENRIVKDGLIVIPSSQDSYFQSLQTLVAAFPNACFMPKDFDENEEMLPREIPSLMIVMGKENAKESAAAIVRNATINFKPIHLKNID